MLLQPHGQETNPAWQPIAWLFHLVPQGSLAQLHPAVLFFFVLSGFVLTASIVAQPDGAAAIAKRFFIGRLCRIYPAVIGATGLFCLIYFLSGLTLVPAEAYSPPSMLRNLLLVSANINGVTWSLRAEMVALPLILAGALLTRTRAAPWLWLVAVLLAGLMFSRTWSNFGAPRVVSPLSWLHTFVFGILAYQVGKKAFARIGAGTALALAAGSIVLFFAAPPLVGHRSLWVQVFQPILAGTLISVLTFGPGTALHRLLNVGILRFYGRISYSFYLLSPLALLVIWNLPDQIARWLEAGVSRTAITLLFWVGTIVTMTPVAYLSYRYVELPGIAFGKRLVSARGVSCPRVD